jgi:hypothetical protein
VVGLDPRIVVTQANIYPQDNGVLVEIQIQTVPGQTAQFLQLFFDQQNNLATVS